METKVNLKIKTLLFYLAIAPFILFGTFYNLVGLINGTGSDIGFGVFGFFGFILLPLLLFSTYKQNQCDIKSNAVRLNKNIYSFADYNFQLKQKELAFKNRPLFSIWKKTQTELIIQDKKTNKVVLQKDLNMLEKDLEKLKVALPISNY